MISLNDEPYSPSKKEALESFQEHYDSYRKKARITHFKNIKHGKVKRGFMKPYVMIKQEDEPYRTISSSSSNLS